MRIGILYNTFLCFLCGIASIAVFYTIQKKRRKKNVEYSQGLDWFLFLFGLLWFFIGARSLMVWSGQLKLNLLMFKWVSGPLVYIHLFPGFVYFGWSFLGNKEVWRRVFLGFFTVMICLAVFTFFSRGFTTGAVTYWGAKHKPNSLTNKIFLVGIFAPAMILIVWDLIRRLKAWRNKDTPRTRRALGFSVGFLVYALMGVFDAVGKAGGWMMILSRLGITLAPLTFYFFSTWEE